MGKAKKQVLDDDDAVFAQRAVELKDEAQKLKDARNFAKAASAYQQCIELVGASNPGAADLFAAKSQCHLALRHWADVVADATRALKIAPKNVDALVSRARAYQATGQEKKAKADAQSAVASDGANADAKALLESFEPKKPVAGLGGMSLDKPSKPAAKSKADQQAEQEEELRKKQAALILKQRQEAEARRLAQQRSWGPPVTVKAVAGADVRTFVVPTMIAHKDLMSALQKKFPDVSAFTVRYSAPDGTLKPVSSRHDFATAVAAAQGGDNKGKPAANLYGGLHPVRLIISELTRLDAPACDDEGAEQGAEGSTSGQQLAPNEVVEIDEWILDFAALFREHLGIDAEAHLDLHAEGLDKCNHALEPQVSAEDADAVLDDAAQKFQEAAALALFNWGNVHMCAARKAMDGGRDPPLEEGGPPGAAVATADNRDEVISRLDQAKSRYEAALGVKPDFHDATIALAQRRYERARLLTAAAGLSGAGESPAKGNADSDEAEAEFSGACADFDAVLAILPEDPPKPEKEPEKKEEKKEGEEEEAEQPSMRAQVQVMWGNTLFEQSQMRARLGKEWRPLLDVAVEKFKGAGCAEADIEQALKVHRGVRAEKEA